MDWKALAFNHVEKTWGCEDWLVNCEKYCAKVLTIEQHRGGSYHHHAKKDESFLCLAGKAQLLLEGEDDHAEFHELGVGGSVRIPPKTAHLLIGLSEEPCQLLEVSTHHTDEDVVRHFRIDGRGGTIPNT